ncbi:M41 family metallopeptidase [Ralstonia solanacearum]|uniref:hypothetical protein n=1 Tax=Ralstonia solanacearum TaxID=305 RepID=UPI0018D042E5
MSRSALKNRMAVFMGGQAAETLTFKEKSTVAADDLNKATDVVRNMVTRFSMNEKLGQMTYRRLWPVIQNWLRKRCQSTTKL